jgi:hypothetical protein
MCLICVEFQKEKMTIPEARRAFREMRVSLDSEHIRQVEEMLVQAESDQSKAVPESDDDLN